MNKNDPPFSLLPKSLNPQKFSNLVEQLPDLPEDFEKYFLEFNDNYETIYDENGNLLEIKFEEETLNHTLEFELFSSSNESEEQIKKEVQKINEGTKIIEKEILKPKKIKKYARKIPMDWNPPLFFPTPEFSFQPDLFQLQSFYYLTKNTSLLLTAHTSSGKTSIVDYAIALIKLNNTKLIYTSPIKALSNQKYNEFKKYNPGIITGDVKLNTESNILIMTTEILRNLLYARSNLLYNVEFIIFDEVHYLNDKERGVVWEECIISIPKNICVVMLSASVPNALEFGEWVGRIRDTEIVVVETKKRVVPLEYYLCEEEEIRCIKKEKTMNLNLNEMVKEKLNLNQNKSIQKKINCNQSKPIQKNKTIVQNKSVQKNIISNRPKDNTLFLVNYITKEKLTPCIYFCFSKRKCHELAKKILKPRLNNIEKQNVIEIIKNRFDTKLSKKELGLPQVEEIKNLLLNGVAVHHSGLLPILKELIEILFSQNLIKILFATETFSMGVNFPAKSVIFYSLRKRDDDGIRLLNSGEFMQMSGRAGRRGIDKKGIVIISSDGKEKNLEFTVNSLIKSSNNINSRFKLTYNMILQMLRSKMKVEDVLRRSFCEEKIQKNIFKEIEVLNKLEKKYENILNRRNNGKTENLNYQYVLDCKVCHDLKFFILSVKEIYKENNELIKFFINSISDFGDFSFVMNDLNEIKIEKIEGRKIKSKEKSRNNILTGKKKVNLYEFEFLFKDYKNYLKRFVSINNYEKYTIDDIFFILKNNEPFFDYNLNDYQKLLNSMEIKNKFVKLKEFTCLKCPSFDYHFSELTEILILEEKIKNIKFLLDDKSLSLFHDYFSKISLLKEKGYIDENNNILLKGRIACEIKTVDEIVITEIIVNNLFRDFSYEEIMGFVSGLILKEGEEDNEISKELKAKIDIDFRYNGAYFNAIKEWCLGKQLSEIVYLYNISEGTIVRTILRLDEFCREIKNICLLLNDQDLNDKIDMCIKMLKRDIVNCNSLYFDE